MKSTSTHPIVSTYIHYEPLDKIYSHSWQQLIMGGIRHINNGTNILLPLPEPLKMSLSTNGNYDKQDEAKNSRIIALHQTQVSKCSEGRRRSISIPLSELITWHTGRARLSEPCYHSKKQKAKCCKHSTCPF